LFVLLFLMGLLALIVSGSSADGKLYALLYRSSFFKIGNVWVLGNRVFSKEEILKIADIHSLVASGNLWSFPRKQVGQKLMSFGRFKRVSVCLLPPQRVLILVQERKPIALVNAGAVYGMDEKGKIFPLGKREKGLALPLLTGIPVSAVLSCLNLSLVSRCQEIFRAAEEQELLVDISEINIADQKNIVMYMTNAVYIKLGDQNFVKKFYYLKRVWGESLSQQKKVKSIDLRWEGQVVVQQG